MGNGCDDVSFAAICTRVTAGIGEDPYDDVDVSTLPEWWQRAIAEHEAHGLRPYVPPVFTDRVPKFEVVDRLEMEYDVTIDFVQTSLNEPWRIRVDGEPVGTLDRRRESGGASTVLLTSTEFSELVRDHVESR